MSERNGPTDGPWEIDAYGDVTANGEDIARISSEESHAQADAALIAEAGNVYHETGLTPRQLASELNAHKAARIAYANEFPLNADDEPDVGSIHENIRKLAEQRDELLKACKLFLSAMRTTGMSNGAIRAAEDSARAIIAKVEAKP